MKRPCIVTVLIFFFITPVFSQRSTAIGDAKIGTSQLANDISIGRSNLPKCAGADYSCGEPYKITYIFIGTGNWNISSNWLDNTIPPTVLPGDAEIIIDPVPGTECILNTAQTIEAGAEFIIIPGKIFRVAAPLEFLK